MADTIRESIIRDIVIHLGVIRKENAYQTDCGRNVYRALSRIDPDDAPCIDVWPLPEEAENIHGRVRSTMTVQVEGFGFFDKEAVKRGQSPVVEDASTVSERILGDLIAAIEATDKASGAKSEEAA